MELSNQQFEAIVEEVTKRLRPVVQATSQRPGGAESGMPAMVLLPPEFYQSQRDISDRVTRLEERFLQFDRRFEEMQHQMDKRFEAVDKRFETVDKRFEGLDRRFNGLVALISLCSTIVGGLVVLFQVL